MANLGEFIKTNKKQIINEWETFARSLKPAAEDMTSLALRDHINEILEFIVSDINSPQTSSEQIKKSHGEKKTDSHPTAAETHAALRLAGGFNIDQMVSEYHALRASIIRLWNETNITMSNKDVTDLIRFNESIDQELSESVSHYTKKVSYSKDLFIGILSHEIRSPLNVISMSSQLLLDMGLLNQDNTLNERQAMLVTQISESTSRITKIVVDLLDVTRARFGAGLSVVKSPMDMGVVSRQLVDEMRVSHPSRNITLNISGEIKGCWDKARIGQVFSNLIGNAIQYSFKDSSIVVVVEGTETEVVLSVHNNGIPISPEKTRTIFDSLTRAVTDEGDHPSSINLGLGLYITNEIVVSHGGTIDLFSSKEKGTTFTVSFPK